MTLKKFAYTSYYALVALILASQVSYTLYQASLTVGNGRKLHQLEERKNELVAQQQQLQSQVSGQLSLNRIAPDQLTEYQTIAKPIMIQVSDNLAAAN